MDATQPVPATGGTSPIAINAVLTMRTIDLQPRAVLAAITYHPKDPYALQLAIATGPDSTVTWVFARDLLRAGLTASAGDGDVHIEPCQHEPTEVLLTFGADPSGAGFSACAMALGDFLHWTYLTVPSGGETALAAAELHRLYDGPTPTGGPDRGDTRRTEEG